jgi:hypothetical protein
MRDIREDLKERIATNNKRRADLKAHYDVQTKALDDETALLSRLLAFEEHRFRVYRGGREFPAPTIPLAMFFVETLRKMGPMTKDELRRAAVKEGYFEDDDDGGRSTHASLLNSERGNRVKRLEDGRYEAVPQPSWVTAFEMVAKTIEKVEGIDASGGEPPRGVE